MSIDVLKPMESYLKMDIENRKLLASLGADHS